MSKKNLACVNGSDVVCDTYLSKKVNAGIKLLQQMSITLPNFKFHIG